MPWIVVKTDVGEEYRGEFVRFSTPPDTGKPEIGIYLDEHCTVYVPLGTVEFLWVDGDFPGPLPLELEEYFIREERSGLPCT